MSRLLDGPRAARARGAMVDALVVAGEVGDRRIEAALRAVPRHVLVPRVHGSDDGLAAVYRDATLLVEPPQGAPRSSSTMPSLLALMIEALGLRGDERVLEIGTGTGYNTALLCHLVGDRRVASVDIERDLVEAARRRLADLGHHPDLRAADGAEGWPDDGTFDRVLATCAAHRIPSPWIDRLRVGGRLVAPVRRGLAVVDRVHERRAEGRFHAQAVYFMPLRGPLTPAAATLDGDGRSRRPVRCGALDTVHHRDVRFVVDLALPEVSVGQHGPALSDVLLLADDGSVARLETDDGGDTVEQSGPRRLWDEVEAIADQYAALGAPTRDRFGITIVGDEQTVWLDDPAGPSWSL